MFKGKKIIVPDGNLRLNEKRRIKSTLSTLWKIRTHWMLLKNLKIPVIQKVENLKNVSLKMLVDYFLVPSTLAVRIIEKFEGFTEIFGGPSPKSTSQISAL